MRREESAVTLLQVVHFAVRAYQFRPHFLVPVLQFGQLLPKIVLFVKQLTYGSFQLIQCLHQNA
jgi:hypothetical protein